MYLVLRAPRQISLLHSESYMSFKFRDTCEGPGGPWRACDVRDLLLGKVGSYPTTIFFSRDNPPKSWIGSSYWQPFIVLDMVQWAKLLLTSRFFSTQGWRIDNWQSKARVCSK